MSTPCPNMEMSLEMADNVFMAQGDGSRNSRSAEGPSLAELIERGRAGDEGALEGIYFRFKGLFFGLARRHTGEAASAEDLLQEIFIKIFTHLDDVKSADLFPAWAYRIALNTCYSYLREMRAEFRSKVPMSDVEATMTDARDRGPESDLKKPLEEAIRTLPKRLREVFLLHDVQGFKHEEIAGLLGLSVGTSKSQLFKARLRLRGVLRSKAISLGEHS